MELKGTQLQVAQLIPRKIFIERCFVSVFQISFYRIQIDSLQAQLEAMERAFAVQERVSSRGYSRRRTEDGGNPEEYFDLLQRWRKETLHAVVEKLSVERHLRGAIEEKKRLRAQSSEQMQGLEAKLLCANERVSALSGQLTHLKTQLAMETENNACHAETVVSLRERLTSQGQVLNNLRHIAEETWREIAVKEEYLKMSQAAARLHSMESRLVACFERLDLARSAIALKEVSIRNSVAAFEAEKQLWLQKLTTNDMELNDSEDPSVYLSELVLRPEAESILKAIFRMLDPEGLGFVAITSIQRCAGPDGVGSLYPTLVKALGVRVMEQLLHGLKALVDRNQVNVTWGELLLLFFPTAGDEVALLRASLSGGELSALQHDGLWGDEEWGVVPLSIPQIKIVDNLLLNTTRSEEEIRLSHERAYLMKRCQEMGRTLERRAEGIKAFFSRELKVKNLSEQSLKAQVTIVALVHIF